MWFNIQKSNIATQHTSKLLRNAYMIIQWIQKKSLTKSTTNLIKILSKLESMWELPNPIQGIHEKSTVDMIINVGRTECFPPPSSR